MSNATGDDVHRAVAVLDNEIKHITERLDKQDRVLEDQSKDIKLLLEMANKSSGALWILMGVSSIVGALIGNLPKILAVFIK